MANTYKGRYQVKNPDKYKGDISKVTYRSSWELSAFNWCDKNSSIKYWNSEEIVISYLCRTDNKQHRYFTDLYIEFNNGAKYLIEIKPKKETIPPRKKKNQKRFLQETLTYAKNLSKWQAAKVFADNNNMTFEVWNEDSLKSLGIKIL